MSAPARELADDLLVGDELALEAENEDWAEDDALALGLEIDPMEWDDVVPDLETEYGDIFGGSSARSGSDEGDFDDVDLAPGVRLTL